MKSVLPVFEALLTWASMRHAPIRAVQLGTSDPARNFSLIAPRIGKAPLRAKQLHPYELLFRRADAEDPRQLVERTRELFTKAPDFMATFLGHERAPAPFVDDRLRASFFQLAHLADIASPDLAQHSPVAQQDPFQPPPKVMAIPRLVDQQLSPSMMRALQIPSREKLLDALAPAFAWVNYRTGTSLTGAQMLELNLKLRPLIFRCVLQWLGWPAHRADALLEKHLSQRT